MDSERTTLERFQFIKDLFEFERLSRNEEAELIAEVERLREAISISGVTETMAKYTAEIERLLQVCEAIHKWCATEDAAQALPYEPPWYHQLRAAIAKARGE